HRPNPRERARDRYPFNERAPHGLSVVADDLSAGSILVAAQTLKALKPHDAIPDRSFAQLGRPVLMALNTGQVVAPYTPPQSMGIRGTTARTSRPFSQGRSRQRTAPLTGPTAKVVNPQ